jgi:FAD/FMN-containing dehydrogenase
VKKFIKSLKKFLKPAQVLDKPEDLHLYDTDATALFKKKPSLVLIPYTAEELSLIIKAINSYNGRVAERTSSRLRRTNDRSVLRVHEDHEDDENAGIGVPLHAHNDTLENKTERLSFVARGAGTGLSGGAIAAENSVIISVAMLNRLLEVDLENRLALVESGYVNATLNKALLGTGLHFAPDPSSLLVVILPKMQGGFTVINME